MVPPVRRRLHGKQSGRCLQRRVRRRLRGKQSGRCEQARQTDADCGADAAMRLGGAAGEATPGAQASSAADCRKRKGTAATPPSVRRRLNEKQSACCEQELRELGDARVVRERAEQPGMDLVHGQRDRYESEFCFEMDMSEASWSCDGGSDLDIE